MSTFPRKIPVSKTRPALLIERGTERHETTQFLAAIVQSSEDAIIGESTDGVITSWNNGAERMFGYSREEVLGQSISILHSPGDSEELAAILEGIRRGIRTSYFETTRRRKDGTQVDVSISVSPVRNENGQILGAAKIIHDITDRKRAEELTRRTEKLEIANRLATSVAHEINNPLSALTNLLYLIKSEELPAPASGYVALAEHELARVSHITTQALGFYQESGSPSESELSVIMDQALALHTHRIEANGIIVEKLYGNSIPVPCRSGEVKQVFVNFIGNAMDAMSAHGRLRIRIRSIVGPDRQPTGVRVSISDTGCGMSKESVARLFEPFYTTKGQARTGLGLWMCQQIVMRHRGSIKILSNQQPRNHGTVVTLFFPRQA